MTNRYKSARWHATENITTPYTRRQTGKHTHTDIHVWTKLLSLTRDSTDSMSSLMFHRSRQRATAIVRTAVGQVVRNNSLWMPISHPLPLSSTCLRQTSGDCHLLSTFHCARLAEFRQRDSASQSATGAVVDVIRCDSWSLPASSLTSV